MASIVRFILQGTEIWHKTTGLGLISCVAIGDIFNYGRNALVVVCGDGWVHIYYSPRSVNPSTNTINNSQVINKEFLDKIGTLIIKSLIISTIKNKSSD